MSEYLNPNEEGITHINVYSKSKLEIGKMLSNFYHCEIDTSYGKFQSVEAYWHYLSLPYDCEEKEQLKELYGYSAKDLGEKLISKYKHDLINCDIFEELIADAIKQKFLQNKEMLLENKAYLSLPFEHYYIFETGRIVNVKEKHKWMIDTITCIRAWIIDNYL